jgi:hypothetical protein
MLKISYRIETDTAFFIFMNNQVTLNLEHYDRIRDQAEAFKHLNGKEEMFYVVIDTRVSGCGIFSSQYLHVLTKDETVKLLMKELNDVKCKLSESESKLLKIGYEAANKRKWF